MAARVLVALLWSGVAALHIVGESARWVVVDKPHGVPCHANSKGEGVLTLLRRQQVARGESDAAVKEYRLVHRLDDGTSGCLVVAKDRDAAATLGSAFRERRVRKAYVALTASEPKKKKATIAGDLVKARRGAWKLDRSCSPGACACTVFTRTVGLGAPAPEAGDAARRLLVARPVTGKTHQIRVAAKANGAPLLGDALYGAQQADRLYLHAAAIAVDDVGIDVSTPPTAGAAFLSDRFAAAWAALDWAEELADRKLPKAARAFRAPPPPS